MTVPGKGGRPRKWRSDTDRVRAYRARQRGEDEPATFEVALVDGDDLARAVERNRELRAELVVAIDSLAEIDAALQAERRRHLATQRKLDRARSDLDAYRSTNERRAEELRLTRDEIDALTVEAKQLRLQLARPQPPPEGPNRAARREAAKHERAGR